ncbi:hypothetical protein [Sulfoacidibacillus thermotolerans]|uniref:Uncharacterized protein n=1 Tax=Sulfoacidibacillus thermotolerans TaxID=1765684 RepID=A0A2U3D8L2_SULT2|nr:hypothetical protein [Sulfoacidibacillus thermotolerans]PWI57618.1 hypothetical protein BM613_07420 [Sulfoacidibacillus thermotolerans]
MELRDVRLRANPTRVQRRRSRRPQAYVILLVGAMVVFLLWVLISANPFQTTNPFLRQTTIGQSVLGDWRYGGSDATGQMKFYDAYQSVVIPGNATTFAADGQFVTIDAHTPTTITFEPSYESETIGPTVFLWMSLFVAAGIVAFHQGSKQRGRQRFVGRRKGLRFRK